VAVLQIQRLTLCKLFEVAQAQLHRSLISFHLSFKQTVVSDAKHDGPSLEGLLKMTYEVKNYVSLEPKKAHVMYSKQSPAPALHHEKKRI